MLVRPAGAAHAQGDQALVEIALQEEGRQLLVEIAGVAPDGVSRLAVADERVGGCHAHAAFGIFEQGDERPEHDLVDPSGQRAQRGGANGSLTVTASGGSGSGYQYSDNNGSSFQSGNAFSGLSAATYEIVVKDGNGCLSSATGVTITQPSSALSCSVAPSSATVCAGSSQTVTASASGGTAGDSYSWTGPNSFSASTAAITINNAQSANAGTYTCTVTDANGCTSQCTATLTVNSAPSISASPTNLTVCSDSTAQFNVTASGTSLQYFWRQRGSGWGATDGWSFNLNGGGDGTNGTFIGDSSSNGPGGHSNIDSSAGTAFGMYANSGVAVDAYRAFGSLAVGQTIQVDLGNGWVNSGGSEGVGIQNSGGTNLWEFFFAGGNNNYTMNDASGATTNNMPVLTYNGVRVTFTLTSSNTYSATITTPATSGMATTYGPFTGMLMTAGSEVPTQVHFWNFNAGSGSANDFFFNNLYVGGVPGTASIALYSDDAANYTNSSAWTGGSNYGQGPIANVLPGATEFSGVNTATLTIDPATSIDASNYDVVVTNSCGAARCNAALLTVNALPNIYNVTGGGAYCSGGSGVAVTLSGSASNIAYCLLLGGSSTGTNWTGTGSALSTNVTAAGAYTILASNTTTGCAATMNGSVTVTVNPTPSCSVSPASATICAGGSQTFTVTPSGGTPGYTYLWSDGSTGSTLTTNAAGTYSVTVTDSNGCTTTCSATLTVNPLPTVSVNSSAICAGGSAILTATTGASAPSYLWSPGGATTASITVSPASTTTYTVTVTDGSTGCAKSGSGTVTVNPLPTVSVNSATVCAGGSATLTATTSASSPSYLWSPGGATTASITVSPASTTTYTVTVTDGSTGCAKSGSGTVTVNPLPTASAGPAQAICAGGSVQIGGSPTASGGSNNGYTYSWLPTTGLSSASAANPIAATFDDDSMDQLRGRRRHRIVG